MRGAGEPFTRRRPFAPEPAAATSRRTTTSKGPCRLPRASPASASAARDLGVVAVERALHDEALGSRPHERGVGAPAREEEQGVHDERLAGAGLPGQDRQPLAERDLDVLEDGEVTDAKGRQHASALAGAPLVRRDGALLGDTVPQPAQGEAHAEGVAPTG